MDISIVIPLLNEEESIKELFEWISTVMKKNKYDFEVIFIDDGSKDNSWSIIESLNKEYSEVKGIKFQRNYGKSAALQVGFQQAKGDYVCTMDADLQDSPEEIPEMIELLKNKQLDLVSGWKKKRFDPISKTVPTKLYNWTARKLTGIYLHDFNCGLKAYRRSVVKSIELYGDMHRYIPVLAKFAGYNQIGEKEVKHQARKYGKSKFGMNRFVNGPLDLMSVIFMGKFGKKPMHFFGVWGILMFLIGFALFFYMTFDKLFIDTNAKLIADRTEFFIALTCMILGVQFFLTGFVAEMIGRNSGSRNIYLIEKSI